MIIHQCNTVEYPSSIALCAYGKCIVANKDLEPGTIVEKFTGPIVHWEEVPVEDACYALLLENMNWLIPTSPARYINHSCNPNSIITEDNTVVTIRPVNKGSQITLKYNACSFKENNPGQWDTRWTFQCQCGAPNCLGLIDKYVFSDDHLLECC